MKPRQSSIKTCLPLDATYWLCFGSHSRNAVFPGDEMNSTITSALSAPVAIFNYSIEMPVSSEDSKKEETIFVPLPLPEAKAAATAAALPSGAPYDAPDYCT